MHYPLVLIIVALPQSLALDYYELTNLSDGSCHFSRLSRALPDEGVAFPSVGHKNGICQEQ